MKNELTLGSLFDGSGGFPLGGMLAGITPLWASEIEPFAVRVTTKRLPQIPREADLPSRSVSTQRIMRFRSRLGSSRCPLGRM